MISTAFLRPFGSKRAELERIFSILESLIITCYDCNGDIVKRVTSADAGTVEYPENTEGTEGTEGTEKSVKICVTINKKSYEETDY